MTVSWEIRQGDALDGLREMPDESAQTCITSPPYFRLRDYGHPRQIGLEPTPDDYVARLVEVFREVRRVLRDDGTLWLNLGDCYGSGEVGRHDGGGVKPKDLLGVPWMVAFALRADGWYLRSDIVWAKPNPMPESVTDRPTRAHEYLFLLSKSARYLYDADAIREEDAGKDHARNVLQRPEPSGGVLPEHRGIRRAEGRNGAGRNKRSVWTVATQPFSFGAHPGGKTYRASPDCPEHGLLAALERWQRAADGAPQDHYQFRIDCTDACRALERLAEYAANSARSSCGFPSSGSVRTSQSNDGHRTQVPSTGEAPGGSGAPPDRTTSSQARGASLAGSSDSLALPCASAATSRSTESRRTDPAPETSPACTPSAGTAGHTGDTPARSASSERMPHTAASSTSAGADADEKPTSPSARRSSRRSSRCTCEEIVRDHFAVFPPKLVEPCVLAGSSPRACGKCGAPWERAVERKPMVVREGPGRATAIEASAGSSSRTQVTGTMLEPPDSKTVGWQPTCGHADGTGSAVVLDPFAGTGTTGLVALRHGRSFIGIELSPTYAQMARDRIIDDAPLLNSASHVP